MLFVDDLDECNKQTDRLRNVLLLKIATDAVVVHRLASHDTIDSVGVQTAQVQAQQTVGPSRSHDVLLLDEKVHVETTDDVAHHYEGRLAS